MKPPTIHSLLEDPVYRRMFKTVPFLPESLRWGNPWTVWGRTVDGPWRGKEFRTYQDAWAMTVKCIRNPTYEDVAIVSRRLMIPPPAGATWDWQFDWCSRCRRPSSFTIRPNHHALRNAPARITDTSEPRDRCYYCGMRRVSMPTYHG